MPYVYYEEPPTGPDAGKFLQPPMELPTATPEANGQIEMQPPAEATDGKSPAKAKPE